VKAAKAIYAAIVAALGALGAVLVGDVGFADVTAGQWVAVVLAGLVAGGGVYGIRNAPSE
jgi:hypothetical protein